MLAMGIDIGGSGIKGAIVDTLKGEIVSERIRIKTPASADAPKILSIVQLILDELEWCDGPVGIGFPGVIRNQKIQTAVNLHPGLVGFDFSKELRTSGDRPVRILNDADAAGFAEMRLGAGKAFNKSGTVLLITVGTGIGTVLFSNGVLVPNLELGHIELNGTDAEKQISDKTRKDSSLGWKEWGKRFNQYLTHMEFITQPDLIIIGGGGAKKPEKFEKYVSILTEWVPAHFGNRAGIIGAAIASAD